MDPLLAGRAIVGFLGGIRATVFFVLLLLALAGGKWWQHKAHTLQVKVDAASAALAVEQADKARILAQLASADNAAKVAIAAKVEAEKAAAKRLAAREKEWRRILGAKPENKAWAEQKIPQGVLDFLHDEPPCLTTRKVGGMVAVEPCK